MIKAGPYIRRQIEFELDQAKRHIVAAEGLEARARKHREDAAACVAKAAYWAKDTDCALPAQPAVEAVHG